jgi:hypothetical protein
MERKHLVIFVGLWLLGLAVIEGASIWGQTAVSATAGILLMLAAVVGGPVLLASAVREKDLRATAPILIGTIMAAGIGSWVIFVSLP